MPKKPKVSFDITAKNKTKAAFSKVNKGLGAMKLAGVAAGAALIAVFVKLSAQILKTGDQIHKLSIRLGISTEALSELRHVAELSGVKIEGLNTGLQRMIRRVSEAAHGTGEAKNAIKELGLEAAALAQMKPDKMFETIADAIFTMKDPADKVRIAFKLFDTEGVGFLQMMEKGAAGIRELRKETKTVFTREDANRIAAVNDTMTRFKDSITAAAKEILLTLIPAIESLGTVTNKVAGFFKWWQEGLKAIAGPQNNLATLEADLDKLDKKIARIRERMQSGMKFWKDENVNKAQRDLNELLIQRETIGKLLEQSIERERQAILKKNAAEDEAAKKAKALAAGGDPSTDLDAAKKLADERLKIKADLTEKIKALTLSEYDFQRWKLGEEIEAIRNSKAYQESMATDLAEYKKLQLKSIAAAQAQTIADQIAEEKRLTQATKDEADQREKDRHREADQRRKELDQLREEILTASNDVVAGWKRGMDEYIDITRSGFEQTRDLAYDTAQSMENSFETLFFDVFTGRLKDLEDYFELFLKGMARSLSNMLAENLTKGFAELFKNIGAGNSGRTAPGAFPRFGLPGFAAGGRTTASGLYIVGEKGPEIFAPGTSGTVIPNNKIGGAPPVTINFTNKTSQQAEIRQEKPPFFDGQKWVLNIVMDGINRNVNGIRNMLGLP